MGTGGLAAVVFLCTTGPAHAAGGHDHSPKHGGVVAEAGDLDFELVARADSLTLHVRDHGKALPMQGASAKLTLLAGTERIDAQLAPAGADRLEAKGAFKLAPGTKVVAAVTIPGRKPANVRFVLK
ncbi:MAG: hypothetical protein O9972_24250 [Burkholderiales bacterium]|nr:hypothetical protein [Burkholderiales bacterium]